MAKFMMIQLQPYPYAGTAYLNAAARSHGHEFILYLGTNVRKILSEISLEKPDCIGFSCMTGIHNEAIKIAREIKKCFDVPTIMGGPHPTLFPEVVRERSIDMICRGEGEYPLIDLLNAIENKKPYTNILNLWVEQGGQIIKNELRPLIDPLDNIPLIDWTCYQGTVIEKSVPHAFLIRGCPYACSYCFNDAVREMYKGLGHYIRCFSVGRSIQEIQQALNFFSGSTVIFSSDTFGIDLSWTEDLFFKYSQITSLPFVLLARPELVTSDFINVIKKYNCHAVAIGVESGSERVRKEILNRKYSNELLLNIAKNLHDAGIKFRTYNMIGLPSETIAEIWETIDLNIQMKTDFPRTSIFMPYPGTKIVKITQDMGYLDENFDFDFVPPSILSHSLLKNVNHHVIINILHFFQTVVLFPRLKPLIKRLVQVKPNLFSRLWFYFVYIWIHKKSERRRLGSYIPFILANYKTKA